MNRFYGFDLGDAESAVARLDKDGQAKPEILTVEGEKSFITAYAQTLDGQLLIGEKACYEPETVIRKERFKSRFLTSPETKKDIAAFAAGVLADLCRNAELEREEDTCFYIGCPAGWDSLAREDYRLIFEKTGYPPARIISESRAALVSACQSRHLQIGYDILNKPVLVVDIGSSTTDFAYINQGKEVVLQTGGEVFLGGGLMDEIVLEESVERNRNADKIRRFLADNEVWHSYCDFAARRLKEKYFADEEYWRDKECLQSITLHAGAMPLRLTLHMNAEIAQKVCHKKIARLHNRSFAEIFVDSLQQIKEHINTPELIFLTGGVSAMPVIRSWCHEQFPDSVVILESEPAFSVAKGLAHCGKIDEELREFKAEVEQLIDSHAVDRIVENHMDELYQSCVETLVDPILTEVALPLIEQFRHGEIDRLQDVDEIMQRNIDAYLRSDEVRSMMHRPVSRWLKQIAYELEKDTMPICARHGVPYSALSLETYLSAADMPIDVSAKDLFAIEEMTWLIDTIVTIVVGLLCGGSGAALIASGFPGIAAGAVLSILILAFGKNKMQDAILHAKLPKTARLLIPKGYLKSHLREISGSVKEQILTSLEKEKNEEITERLTAELSDQIELCLENMAKVVEIPLG